MKIILSLMLILGCFCQTPTTVSPSKSGLVNSVLASSVQEIDELIEKLHIPQRNGALVFSNENTRKEIFDKLLLIASRSADERTRVVTSLINLFGNKEAFPDTRVDAAYLLAKLKAIEALDIFFENLNLVRSFSIYSPNIRPVVEYIILMGEAAIPYLEKSLSKDDISKRQQACLLLGYIGGVKAKRVLEKASHKQTDRGVREAIEFGLQEIKRQSFTK